MNTKKLTLIFLFLLASQMLFISLSTTSVTLNDNNTVNLVEEQNFIAETDLNRVETRVDAFENGGFENWDDPHEPSALTTSRTPMIGMELSYSIYSDGVRSGRMEAKGTDIIRPASAYLHLQSWSSLNNPANLTISFDYYIDVIANPQLGDRLELYLPFNNYFISYYIGSTNSIANTSTHAYYELDVGTMQSWNTFERNVTQDYLDAFGNLPQRLDRFVFYVRSYDFEYTRAYIDDVNILNGTYVKVGDSVNAGNFETGYSGSFWWGFGYDTGSGDISQSTERVEGDWSLNITINTVGDTGSASATSSIDKRITLDNKDQFSLYWNIADWQVSTSDSRAYAYVEYRNMTHTEMRVFYVFGYGGTDPSPILGSADDITILVNNFNTTGIWNLFNRSVIDDVNTRYPGAEIEIDEIGFYSQAKSAGSRVSILFDDVSFVTSIINDEGYEDQGAVGDPIYGWDSNLATNPSHTVTDFSANGNKAANITLTDDQEIERYQQLAIDMPINENTEIILDLNWYIETLNESSTDYLFLSLFFDDNSITFPIMNASALNFDDWDFGEDDVFVPQPETNTIGEWVNWQIDIVHTFEDVFGELPDTTLYEINIVGYANTSSSLTVFMDDFYIYMDSAPKITSTDQMPITVDEAGESVRIYAVVVDATEVASTLSYRVDGGVWTNVTMNESTSDFRIDIIALWGVTEYFITAQDAFGKTDVAMNGSEYFTFSAVDTTDPIITLTPTNGSTVSDIVSIQIGVFDGGSGFAGAELFIEGTSIANITLDTVSVSWDTTVIANGEYNITVVAEDNAGNTATVTHLVIVENIGVTPADLSGVLLIIVIVAAIGVVAIIYIFVLKKR